MNLNNFKNQIDEDLNLISNEYSVLDDKLTKKEYAMNLWVQTKLYNVDVELALNNITEYNDKGIDCFVHFEESKDLYLIQNKFYSENNGLQVKEVTHFLHTSLSKLEEGNYKNSELQKIYNSAKNDPEYKIWLHLYITNDMISQDIINVIKEFNKNSKQILCKMFAEVFTLSNIYNLYYGESFKEDQNFSCVLTTENKGTILKILPEEYNLPGMSQAYYIMTPIINLYKIYCEAKDSKYPIFEENIREYLGKSSINTKIIDTLKNENERRNFFYYNNGITIICDSANKLSNHKPMLELHNPQIVNGCQTVNTIYEVLNSYTLKEAEAVFNGVYVMTKVLIQPEKSGMDSDFYKKVVKYTNSQNSINDKSFASSKEYFFNIQNYFEERGFLLLVKPSDKNKYNSLNTVDKNKLLNKAKNFNNNLNVEINKFSDIQIQLDKLLQVALAFIKDGYYAYTKKSMILKPENKEIYEQVSLRLTEYLSIDNLIYLYLFYKTAEDDKKSSQDKKTPMPYYLISFLSILLNDKSTNNLNFIISELRNSEKEVINSIYEYLKALTSQYRAECNLEYNVMIKSKIDHVILNKQIDTLKRLDLYKTGSAFIEKIKYLE